MTEFAEIYETYFRNVELYLRAICRDESLAEELTEQVFFQALKALPSFRGDCDIHVWLCAMARNLYLSHLRKEKNTLDIDELQIPDPRMSMEEQVADRQQAMVIHRILHNLPEPYKEVFSLRIFWTAFLWGHWQSFRENCKLGLCYLPSGMPENPC